MQYVELIACVMFAHELEGLGIYEVVNYYWRLLFSQGWSSTCIETCIIGDQAWRKGIYHHCPDVRLQKILLFVGCEHAM